MAKRKTGPDMFTDLTEDERWILSSKLICGSDMASRVARNHDMAMEIHDVNSDVQAPWRKRK